MPIPSLPPFLPGIIGEAADVLDIEAVTPPGSGALSYKNGWPAITALPLEAGGIAPQREYFNAVNKLLSQHTLFQQAGAVYPWDAALDYPANARVQASDGVVYMALKPSGPDVPNPDGGGMVGPVDPVEDESGHWIKLSLLYGGMPNSEEWITESGEWEAPVSGWYYILIIGGGDGGTASAGTQGYYLAYGGASGGYKRCMMYLSAGDVVPVTIGSGGIGRNTTDGLVSLGGATIFGELTSADGPRLPPSESSNETSSSYVQVSSWGGGFGAGRGANMSTPSSGFFHQPASDGKFYGAGGGAYSNKNGHCTAGNGMQGAVLARWHDPAKAAGPLPEPTLLSARRMAVRAADAPATVNLYDPETGQGSVWREEDAPAQIAKGLISEEAWLEICAAKNAEAYAEWLASPDTVEERFEMLRATRDAKLAEHDVQVVQLQRQARAGADVADDMAAWDAYAVALCDLPAQPGAPWDGGGELTPWPAQPATTALKEAPHA